MVSMSIRAGSATGIFPSVEGLTADGVSAAFENGNTLTIDSDGSNGFGSTGPVVAIWSPLNNGIADELVQSTDPTVGTYATIASHARYSNEYSRYGGISALLYDYGRNGDTAPAILRANFTASKVVRTRFWLYIPTGFVLPHCEDGSYSSGASSYKLQWLFSDSSLEPPDICVPTFNGGLQSTVDGNSSTLGSFSGFGNVDQITRYGYWNMYEVLISAADTDNARIRVRTCNGFHGAQEWSSGVLTDFWSNYAVQSFSRVHLPGYVRTNGFSNCRLYHANQEVTIGNGADCDVILGNASSWDACTDFRHLRPTGWSNSQIEVDVQDIDGVIDDSWYLFVRRADSSLVNYNGNQGRPLYYV